MSALEHQNYHLFDAMSTEDLEALLRLDSYTAEQDQQHTDAILYIMEVLAKRKQQSNQNDDKASLREKLQDLKEVYLPDNDGISLYQFDEDEVCNSKTQQPERATEQTHKRIRLVARRVGLVAAVVAAIFGLMITVQAAGVDVFGAIARWTDETFHFSVPEAGAADMWFADYQDELEAVGLSEEYLPTWIPEGYEVTDLQIQELAKRAEIYILYGSENDTAFDLLVSIYGEPEDMGQSIFEKDETPVQTIQAGNKTIYLFENLGLQIAACQYQNAIYSLVGDLPNDLVENIFASIGDG